MFPGLTTGKLHYQVHFIFWYDYSGHVQENSGMILNSGDFIYCVFFCIVICGFYRLLLNLKQFPHKRGRAPAPNSEGWTRSPFLGVVLMDYFLPILG